MKKIIKNGIIVTAADTYTGDVLIEDGIITGIGLNLEAPGAEIVDASGCYVFPGGLTRIRIWICLLAVPSLLTILRPARWPPPMAEPQRLSTSA